jgi:hypothetical protein
MVGVVWYELYGMRIRWDPQIPHLRGQERVPVSTAQAEVSVGPVRVDLNGFFEVVDRFLHLLRVLVKHPEVEVRLGLHGRHTHCFLEGRGGGEGVGGVGGGERMGG